MGCNIKPARQRVDTDIVRAVRFEGNGGVLSGQTDYQLRNQMAHGDSGFGLLLWPLMYFVDPELLELDALEEDAYRLEVWYAHNGWFDAAVSGWEVRRIRRPKSFRAGVVDVVGQVDSGEPSMVRSFDISGLNRNNRLLGDEVRRTGYVHEGSQFNLEAVYATRDLLLKRLHEHAFAYARVDVSIDSYPEDHAVDVAMETHTGISAVFGPITISGNKKVKTKIIQEALPFSTGQTYNSKRLTEAQSDLFDLGTFALVAITPDLSDPTSEEVPVQITVNEARFRRLRLGGGVEWDVQTLTPKVSTEYRQLNMFRSLIRMDLSASAGYAYSLGGAGIGDVGLPIYEIGAGLTYPRFIASNLTLSVSAEQEQDLFSGQFAYRSPEVQSSLAIKASDEVILLVGSTWEVFELLDVSDAATSSARATFGEGFDNKYQLTTGEVGLSYDDRDDPLNTRNGEYYNFIVRQSLPLQQDDYLFGEIAADLRAYRPFRFKKTTMALPYTIAGRLKGSYLQPWNGSELPYPELSFLGGGSDMRGYRLNQVGPYNCLCTYNGIPGDTDVEATQHYLPVGGRAAAMIATELRYDWAYEVTFAFFGDMGMLINDASDLALDNVRGGVGLGARYNSLVGPIRIDLGFRPLYPEDLNQPEYIRCAEAGDKVPRAYDLFSQPSAARLDPSDRSLPFAFNIFLAIGEAI